MAIVKHIETVSSNLVNVPILFGQIIYCTDTLDMYQDDSTGKRTPVTSIVYLATEQERLDLLAPISNKLYIVKESGFSYIFSEEWVNINKIVDGYIKLEMLSTELITELKDNSALSLTEEGILVGAAVKEINFVGPEVTVTEGESGKVTVTIASNGVTVDNDTMSDTSTYSSNKIISDLNESILLLKDNVSEDGDSLAKLRALILEMETLLTSDDINLDSVQELVTYIKDNKTILDGVSINKVNIADIIDDLVHDVASVPLSSNQGMVLKTFIDVINTNLGSHTAIEVPTTVEQTDLIGMINELVDTLVILSSKTQADMLKSVYDKNNDGKVDRSATTDSVEWTGVNNKPVSSIELIDIAVSTRHAHTNKTTLDLITSTEGIPYYNGMQLTTGAGLTKVSQLLNDKNYLIASNISGKADKVSAPIEDNFLTMDAFGNLRDSGKKVSEFALTNTIVTKSSQLELDNVYDKDHMDEQLVLKTVDSTLAPVAKSGVYSSLTGLPTLSTVSATGKYSDLLNLPTIPLTLEDLSEDTNHKVVTDIQIADFHTHDNRDTIDYFTTDGEKLFYKGAELGVMNLQNLSQLTNDLGYSVLATSAEYSDVLNTPVLSGVAISGEYSDILNTPIIPSTLVELEGDTTHRVVTDIQVTDFHTHSNRNAIDDLTTNGEKLFYKGIELSALDLTKLSQFANDMDFVDSTVTDAKADKVLVPVVDHILSMDETGNMKDSGKTSSDFMPAINTTDEITQGVTNLYMTASQKTKLDGLTNAIDFVGTINSASDFPDPATINVGDGYVIKTVPVTDNDESKTNTGTTFSVLNDLIVWSLNGEWIELGASSTVPIDDNAVDGAIKLYSIDKTLALLYTKVDKDGVKQLSTEDYTSTEKTKLTNVSEDANKTEVSTINGNVLVDDAEVIVYTLNDDSSIQKVSIDKDGTLIGDRKAINFVEGTNMIVDVVDNSSNNRIDVTISANPTSFVLAESQW